MSTPTIASPTAPAAAPAGSPMDELAASLYVVATIGRLAAAGLLERPAPADDTLAVLGQRLLRETGWLAADAAAPGPKARASMPPGAPPASAAGFVRELLSNVGRYAEGAPAGWSDPDPDLIRWRGAASGPLIADGILSRCYPLLPGFPDRLDGPEAAFLDVGTGAAGLAIELCRRHPRLQAVGL